MCLSESTFVKMPHCWKSHNGSFCDSIFEKNKSLICYVQQNDAHLFGFLKI